MSTPAADGITVRRCVVRVIRRGGWSWGPDPQDLVRQVLDALPELLAERFGEHLTGEGPDLEITEPVLLTVKPPRAARNGLAPAGLVVEPAPVAVPPPRPVAGAPPPGPAPAGASTTEDATMAAGPYAAGEASRTPAALFAELAERGELAALLAGLPDAALRTYLSALLAPAPDAAPAGAGTRAPAPAGPVPAEVIGALAAELARRLSRPPPPATRDGLAELLDALPGAETEPLPPALRADAGGWQRVPAGETRVCFVLPFLLAGPLARTGYLDAIGPALAGIDLPEEAPLLAAALAYKVLDAPERGWRRSGEAGKAAAAFAGLESAPDLTGFAHRVRPALPVLDGVLALSLCRGHDPEDPLLVLGVDGGLLLVDAQGMFPIAWAAGTAGLLPHWEACGRPPVLVCAGPLPPPCLRELAEAGVRLVTAVPPVRDDPLSRLPWRTPLWTTGGVRQRLAAELPALAGRAGDLVRTLFEAHRAVPLAPDRALERSVTLAASLALGLLAWTLWRERETPDPLLALTRFADLEGTVRYSRDTVSVKLPLGRRHADLWRCGALTDVPDVVWLDGRTLTFSGG
ncbi:hypothetical protein [Nonomuraea candida]|uniref:hypothetical protein n=1 Tax=Nonomuraea candida TaxID=359159 RepID=UPI0005B9DAC4|nr:hypothetical protein [Nonomuraea candida]